MPQVRCPKCGQALKLTPQNHGKKVKCSCGAVIRLPELKPRPTTSQNVGSPAQTLASSSAPQVQQRVSTEVPEYHKRRLAKERRAERARERAEERRKEKKQQKAELEDNSISVFVWVGLFQIVGGGIGLLAGMATGYIYYFPIMFIVTGFMTAVWGALFGDGDDEWAD